ncbi:MAG: hypothetical protein QXP05_06520, partial [Ignisphaera sp.]
FRCYVALKFGGSSSSIVDGLVHVAIMFTPNMENKTFNYIFSRCRESLGVSQFSYLGLSTEDGSQVLRFDSLLLCC